MLRLDKNKFSNEFILSIWFLMAFQAGYVNVGGFLTSGNFVSHVTGTSSQIGMKVAAFDPWLVLTFVICLFSFIVGAAFSGHHIARQIEEGKEPRYKFVLLIKCIFFALVVIVSSIQWSNDTDPINHPINLLTIFFLSFCCGVQNSTCALATDGFLKPTHMTGLSTDLGIFLTKVKGYRNDPRYKEDVRKNRIRMALLFSFICGGIVSSVIFNRFEHLGFLFPFFSSLSFLIIGWTASIQKASRQRFVMRTGKGSLFATLALTILTAIL